MSSLILLLLLGGTIVLAITWPEAVIALYIMGWPIFDYYFAAFMGSETPHFRYFFVFAIISCLVYIIRRSFRSLPRIINLYLLLIALLNASLYLFSLIGQGDSIYGLYHFQSMFWRGTFPLALILLMMTEAGQLKRFFAAAALIGGLTGLIALQTFRSIIVEDQFRSVLLFNFSPVALARTCALCALCALALFWKSEKISSSLWLAAFVLATAGTVFTQEKQAILALFVACVVFLLFVPRARGKIIMVIAIIVGMTAIVIFVFPELTWRITYFFANLASPSSSLRLQLYAEALKRFVENPLLGTGVGSGVQIMGEGLYPHNLFLEIASEMGLCGLLLLGLLLMLVIKALKTGYRTSAGNDEFRSWFACLSAIFAFNLIVAMISGNVGQDPNLWVFAGMLWVFRPNKRILSPRLHKFSQFKAHETRG